VSYFESLLIGGLQEKSNTHGISGDEARQWKKSKFDPSSTDLHRHWHAWLRYAQHPTCTFF